MNINMLMQQAQKMQKELAKAQKALEEKVFDFSSQGGAIKIKIKGNREIIDLDIDEDAIDKDEKEMLQDMLKLAINEALAMIDEEFEKIAPKAPSGLGF